MWFRESWFRTSELGFVLPRARGACLARAWAALHEAQTTTNPHNKGCVLNCLPMLDLLLAPLSDGKT
eukprot:scaffold15414_cov114-Isochrysis_galbana.AAC.5